MSNGIRSGKPFLTEITAVQALEVSDAQAGNRMIRIIDSGLDQAHQNLRVSVYQRTSDPGTGDWFTDENSHGTHVAGTIAALANGEGVVRFSERYIGCRIIKVFGASGWSIAQVSFMHWMRVKLRDQTLSA